MLSLITDYSPLILYAFVNIYLIYSYLTIESREKIVAGGIVFLLFFGFPLALIVGVTMLRGFWRCDD